MLDLFCLLYLAYSSLEDQEFLRIAKDAESFLLSHYLKNLLSLPTIIPFILKLVSSSLLLAVYAPLNNLTVGILLLMLIINQRPPRRSG